MTKNRFVRSHGLGNDYLVFEQGGISFRLTPEAIRLICHRNFGVGSDGILLLCPSRRADFRVRIFNPDGSEAEKSGNGLRIFAKYVYERGHTRKRAFTVETLGGIVECRLHVRRGRVEAVTVEMGRATFQSGQIPVAGPDREVVGELLTVGDWTLTVTCVSVGNPHCVFFADALDEAEMRRVGPLVENHPHFPNRINTQMVRVRSRSEIEILIWERGAGWTLASGSSSCAAAAAAYRDGRVDGDVTVHMPGGDLRVEVSPTCDLRMTGPVEEVCTGTLSGDLVRRLRIRDTSR